MTKNPLDTFTKRPIYYLRQLFLLNGERDIGTANKMADKSFAGNAQMNRYVRRLVDSNMNQIELFRLEHHIFQM